MKTWKGATLFEVPDEYRWRSTDFGGGELYLDVVDSKDEYPFVLWAFNGTTVRIAPIGVNTATRCFETGTLEERLHTAVACVLLGVWTEQGDGNGM